jgi:hypothetical protein
VFQGGRRGGDEPPLPYERVEHALDAGQLYVPGSPFTRNALDRLDALGLEDCKWDLLEGGSSPWANITMHLKARRLKKAATLFAATGAKTSDARGTQSF